MTASIRIPAISCAAVVVAVAAVAIAAVLPGPRVDRSIERSYAEAFDKMDAAQSAALGSAANRLDPAHLHLSRLPAVEPAAPALSVGDRITLSARDGGTISYEVIEVRALNGTMVGSPANSDAAATSAGLTLVTAVASQNGTVSKTVRFIVDADAAASDMRPTNVEATKPHAL